MFNNRVSAFLHLLQIIMSLIDNIMAVKCFDVEIKIVVFYRSRMDSLDKVGIENAY